MLPDFIDPEAWEGYVAMRKKMKKPLSDNAVKRAIQNLERLWQQGEDITLVLNQSEDQCWQGLFAVSAAYKQQRGITPLKPGSNVLSKMSDRSWADDLLH
jgi:hypothetical protein